MIFKKTIRKENKLKRELESLKERRDKVNEAFQKAGKEHSVVSDLKQEVLSCAKTVYEHNQNIEECIETINKLFKFKMRSEYLDKINDANEVMQAQCTYMHKDFDYITLHLIPDNIDLRNYKIALLEIDSKISEIEQEIRELKDNDELDEKNDD